MKKIFFPTLHMELVDEKILKHVTLIDPGLLEKKSAKLNYYRPKQFPLNAREAKQYLRDFLTYGDFFENPKEIKQNFIMQLLEFDTEKPSTLKTMIKKESGDTEKIDYFLIAQLTLLLEWTMEERILELQKIDSEIEEGLQQLKETIGDHITLNNFQNTSNRSHLLYQINTLLPYEKLLPWFFLILDNEWVLITDVDDLYEMWIDFGIEFSLVEDSIGLYQAMDYGYRFIFKKKPHEKFTWLNKKYKVEFIKG
ncbi:hypothetical protein [Desulfothermus sp.]